VENKQAERRLFFTLFPSLTQGVSTNHNAEKKQAERRLFFTLFPSLF
jgi:hypothetical protein